ncbi:hypothetical protein ACN20G_33265 (plasmid) [Streptomyces sp. BI20]|uniref:hypothetical protein n=1 Tax=Streptomyces sp. BI20 TaxID=3403460 RepID=UPI003C784C50
MTDHLDGLPVTPENIAAAAIALDRLRRRGWTAVSGYPGPAGTWREVLCQLCGHRGPHAHADLRNPTYDRGHRCVPPEQAERLLDIRRIGGHPSCTIHAVTAAAFHTALTAWMVADAAGDTEAAAIAAERCLGRCAASGRRARAAKTVVPSVRPLGVTLSKYAPGDRLSVLYRTVDGHMRWAHNRVVIEIDRPNDTPTLYTDAPTDADTRFLEVPAHPDYARHTGSRPLHERPAEELLADFLWHMHRSHRDSVRSSWPEGRHGARVDTALSVAEQDAHREQAMLHAVEGERRNIRVTFSPALLPASWR